MFVSYGTCNDVKINKRCCIGHVMFVIYHDDVLLIALYINILYFFVVWLYNASCSAAVVLCTLVLLCCV